MLPVAPEEVAQKGGADEATMHGLFLQHKVLTDLRTEFKGSLGIYSMVQAAPADASHKTDSCGSHQIYVHTKALIVDDVFALVGSANATDRSFRVDTEMAVSWFDPASVRAFRQTVWGELLGSPKGMSSWAAKDYVKKWEAIAKANATAVPSKRSGFVVPHNPEKFKGRKSDRVPDAFAELFNVDLDRGEAMRAVA